MPITIGSNIASLGAQRQLGKASESLSNIYEKLSSGSRINKASDDAAGLAIATSLRTDTRVFAQAIRNVNDGISTVNIADGALSALSNIVIRQQELAESAANGTYSLTQRTAIDKEANELGKEYNRILATTKFNGQNLFSTTDSSVRIQVGYGTDGSISFSTNDGLSHGQGNGTFTATQSLSGFSTNYSIQNIVTGDFNGDGKVDILANNQEGFGVRLFLGNGDGTFQAGTTITLPDKVESMQIGDFNNDGIADFAATTYNGTHVWIGNGNGTFKQTLSGGAGSSTSSVIVGDFNGDGNLDVINNSLGVFLGNGDGTFRNAISIAFGPFPGNDSPTAVGDINGDGKDDLLIWNIDTPQLMLSNGNGSFSVTQYQTNTGTNNNAGFLVDVNHDGKLDVVLGSDSFNGYFKVSLGNGDGTFRAQQSIAANGVTGSMTMADFNGDGESDILVQNITTGATQVFFSNGDGTFSAGVTSTTNITSRFDGKDNLFGTGDFNGDGSSDLVVLNTAIPGLNVYNSSTPNSTSNEKSLYLLNRKSAASALDYLQTLNSSIAGARSKLGASLSRLSIAGSVTQTNQLNYSEAESRIRDADIAQESSNLARVKVLQDASAAVLAQANQAPALALTLLRG